MSKIFMYNEPKLNINDYVPEISTKLFKGNLQKIEKKYKKPK